MDLERKRHFDKCYLPSNLLHKKKISNIQHDELKEKYGTIFLNHKGTATRRFMELSSMLLRASLSLWFKSKTTRFISTYPA